MHTAKSPPPLFAKERGKSLVNQQQFYHFHFSDTKLLTLIANSISFQSPL